MTKQELDLNKIIWLACGVLLASLPHWQRLPLWLSAAHIVLLVMRIYIPYQWPSLWDQQKRTINTVRLLLIFAAVAGIYGSYGALTGRDVGIALLVLLAGFKIFESHSKRDFYISTYLGYFLIITNFFYTQTILTAVYMVCVIIIMTAGLIDFNDTEKQLTLLKRFKLSSVLLIQATPILLVLFIFFPRVNGPLWGMPKDAFTGVTGITDEITPGAISKLAQSNEVAFRVTFKDKIPAQSKLYWRGPVLWHTDGRKWTSGNDKSNHTAAKIEYLGKAIDYEVTMEANNKKWLFGLEMVSEPPVDAYFTTDYQLKTHEPIRARQAFNLTSYTDFQINKKENPDLKRSLALPKTAHPKTRELASKLRNEYIAPTLIIKAALQWFKKQGFVYTMTPPLITGDTVDEFLFNTRQGFCEHYAVAFAVLMRAAGIPARIVAGYQGGEINPIGNYLIVRQYDAHAWTEVWLENQGWVRIDPTAIISPVRINEGIDNAMPDAIIDIPLGLGRDTKAFRLWQKLRNTVDMVNYQWAQWVLGYGPDRQKYFLQNLGIQVIDWKGLTFYLFMLLSIIVIVIALIVFKKMPKATEPARKYYAIFCKKMAKVGLARKAHEGPVDFAKRISETRAELRNETHNITDLYIRVRYHSDSNKLLQLKAAIKSFSPAKNV